LRPNPGCLQLDNLFFCTIERQFVIKEEVLGRQMMSEQFVAPRRTAVSGSRSKQGVHMLVPASTTASPAQKSQTVPAA